jgi:hypothetical protein
MDLNFIVVGEPIHEGQGLVIEIVIDNLVDERGSIFFFGTSMVEIVKVGENTNSAMFLVNRDRVGNP